MSVRSLYVDSNVAILCAICETRLSRLGRLKVVNVELNHENRHHEERFLTRVHGFAVQIFDRQEARVRLAASGQTVDGAKQNTWIMRINSARSRLLFTRTLRGLGHASKSSNAFSIFPWQTQPYIELREDGIVCTRRTSSFLPFSQLYTANFHAHRFQSSRVVSHKLFFRHLRPPSPLQRLSINVFRSPHSDHKVPIQHMISACYAVA